MSPSATSCDADLFSSAHLFNETRFRLSCLIVNLGYSYTSMDTDNDGSSRVYQAITPATVMQGYRPDRRLRCENPCRQYQHLVEPD